MLLIVVAVWDSCAKADKSFAWSKPSMCEIYLRWVSQSMCSYFVTLYEPLIKLFKNPKSCRLAMDA